MKLLRPRIIGEAVALPFVSLAIFLLWTSQKDGPAFCDSAVPASLVLLLLLGPVVEIVRVADPKRVTIRAALLGAASGLVAAVLVFVAAALVADARSCFE